MVTVVVVVVATLLGQRVSVVGNVCWVRNVCGLQGVGEVLTAAVVVVVSGPVGPAVVVAAVVVVVVVVVEGWSHILYSVLRPRLDTAEFDGAKTWLDGFVVSQTVDPLLGL